MPVSPLVVVHQGDVGLTLGSLQLPLLESSSPQGPPEALSMPVSVVRPRPEFRVPPKVTRQAGSVVGSGCRSPASLASPLSCSIGCQARVVLPYPWVLQNWSRRRLLVKVTKRVTSEGKFFLPQLLFCRKAASRFLPPCQGGGCFGRMC